MENISRLGAFIRHTWPLLCMALAGAIGIFWAVSITLEGRFTLEIITVILAGVLSGSLIRFFLRDDRISNVFYPVVVIGAVLLAIGPPPWSGLWLVLIPTSAWGLMVGNTIRIGLIETRPKPRSGIWTVNGAEEQDTAVAQNKALDELMSWNSETSGVFVVEYGRSQFEAAGDSKIGFIVHCTENIQKDDEWRVLGSIDSIGNDSGRRDEVEVHLHFGRAFTPADTVSDMQTARRALEGFFRHLGPDPSLEWTSGGETTDIRFR